MFAKNHNALIVTGMHRSGTSVMMRVCNLLGAEIGDNLVQSLPNDNETGFWEHQHLVDINEEILNRFGTWHLGIGDLPDNYNNDKTTSGYKEKLSGILRRDFSKKEFWGIKDPRIARLMPLWKDVFAESEILPSFIIMLRNPVEVSASLAKRNKISNEIGLLLWLKYNLEAEYHTRSFNRCFVYYPDILSDWKSIIKTASKRLKIPLSDKIQNVKKEIDAFINPDLKHQIADEKPIGLFAKTFEILHSACKNGVVDEKSLDEIREEFAIINAPFQSTLVSNYTAQNDSDIIALQKRIHLLENSSSWRITAPLRFISTIVSK